MARDYSKSKGVFTDSNKKPETKPGLRRFLRAGIVSLSAVLCGVILYLNYTSQSPTEEEQPNVLSGRTSPTTPKRMAKAIEPQRAHPARTIDPNARPTKVGESVNGYVMLPSGRIHKPTGVVTNRVAEYAKSPYSIFDHRSDNEIAAVLMMCPGDTLVRTKRYANWFAKQFLKSIETPILISPDDEPWKAKLKREVIQAKIELKEAYDRGEDIEAIMAETRQQLQDLARYKQSLKKLFSENMKTCRTPQDVADLQEAVNRLLEGKGCAAMNFTALTKQHLMRGKTRE